MKCTKKFLVTCSQFQADHDSNKIERVDLVMAIPRGAIIEIEVLSGQKVK